MAVDSSKKLKTNDFKVTSVDFILIFSILVLTLSNVVKALIYD